MNRPAASPRHSVDSRLIRRTALLRSVNRLGCEDWSGKSGDELIIRCGELLLLHSDYRAILVAGYKRDESTLTDGFLLSSREGRGRHPRRDRIILPKPLIKRATATLEKGAPVLSRHTVTALNALHPEVLQGAAQSYTWPLIHNEYKYGVLVIYRSSRKSFPADEIEFLESIIADFSLALYACDLSRQLRFERDFNTEIIDTIQVLMISITPCGKITRFNPEAEKVTGYTQEEVIDRYWVDILLPPDSRAHYQKIVSALLKKNSPKINFQAPLITKAKEVRTIDWHSSIKPEIEDGSVVGMVLLGLDITAQLETDKAYTTAVEKWENIFSTIQDPALIVSESGKIIDANHATFTASRKTRDEVIGESVCKILHNIKTPKHDCPLLPLLRTGKSRILHTTLHGLQGEYLLTLSPLTRSIGSEKATLLVARDMTEEERLQAEAIRASQLASIGELAAGVAHEINNPINGILNYAQMLADLELSEAGEDITGRIIAESRRIEGIVKNLLDFSRHSIENPEPINIPRLLSSCLDLVKHQLQKEEIRVETDFPSSLPLAFCNGSQIKQVILNTISNSRYALNQKYKKTHSEKKISLEARLIRRENSPFIRIAVTDLGTGIEAHLLEKVFDPFYSTKPNGEGTGLGLSISYGLIRDNGGHIRILSEAEQFTTITVDLPVAHGAQDGKP